jgi:nucleoside-diphosphate-sugar epimerase
MICDQNKGELVLLTGASGFIGTRIQKLLLMQGYRVRALRRKPRDLKSQVSSVVGDLTDLSTCQRAIEDAKIVIHLAGEKRDQSRFWSVNVEGTKNLLNVAVSNDIERFVHVSSVGVVGGDPLQSRLYDEDQPCMPRNGYELTKWEAEKLVNRAASEGLPVTILRPANVFGDADPYRGLLRLIRSLLNGSFMYIGGRDVICNYVYVEDVANACLTLAEHPRAVGRTYNLSDDCLLSEFVDAIADELGVRRPKSELPRSLVRITRTALGTLRHFPRFSEFSVFSRLFALYNQARFMTTRLADELEFRCSVGWRVGLGRLVEWYRSQGEL